MTKANNYLDLKQELDNVLLELQREDIDVDQAINLYKQGTELVAKLEKHLKQAKNEIIELKKRAGNSAK